MPLAGSGMLITVMDIAPEEEADFHRWYDREHFPERVGIDGFLEARRYIAISAPTKYLHLYTTKDIEVLDGEAYRRVLNNQTAWSNHHIPKFINPTRVIGRVVASRGRGRGSVVAFIRLRPTAAPDMLPSLEQAFDLLALDGILSVHMVQGDPNLSKPLVSVASSGGFGDSYIIIDGTTAPAVQSAAAALCRESTVEKYGRVVSSGIYQHICDLSKAEL
jgi:hypothetical protein